MDDVVGMNCQERELLALGQMDWHYHVRYRKPAMISTSWRPRQSVVHMHYQENLQS